MIAVTTVPVHPGERRPQGDRLQTTVMDAEEAAKNRLRQGVQRVIAPSLEHR